MSLQLRVIVLLNVCEWVCASGCVRVRVVIECVRVRVRVCACVRECVSVCVRVHYSG